MAMLLQLAYCETIKYRRTFIPWTITAGGGFAAFVALMLLLTGGLPKEWEFFAAKGLNMMNMLALLLAAVISGYVFLNEYHEGTAGTINTYPVSRYKIYGVKFLIILLMITAMYLSFFFMMVLFGLIFIGEIPSADFLLHFVRFIFLLPAVNFVLSPVTVLVCLLVRAIGTYVITGMGYFLVYMGFLNSDFGFVIPPCMADRLVAEHYAASLLSGADLNCMAAVSAVTFLSAFFAGAVYYSRHAI